MEVRVECAGDETGEPVPRRIHLDGTAVEVVEVVDRWLARDYGYFKVRGGNGALYILRREAAGGRWSLVMFERARPATPHLD